MHLFDTHAHLASEHLAADLPGVLARAKAAGVTSILSVATDLASSLRCRELAAANEGVMASVGIHPTHAGEAQSGDPRSRASSDNHHAAAHTCRRPE